MLHRRGWRQSSTFEAFCDRHDRDVFAPLETVPFSGTVEQTFLIAYRATCWELYQKTRALRAGPVLRRQIDRGMIDQLQRHVQRSLGVQDAGFSKGLRELEAVKQKMDATLLARDFVGYESLQLLLDGPLGIASTGAITPNHTLDGVSLQTLLDDLRPMQWLAFGVDLREAAPCAAFVWRRGDRAPKLYLDAMLALAPDVRASVLAQFFFAHCENTYFSEAWWDALPSPIQAHFRELMQNSNPYYFPPTYDLRAGLSPWRTATPIAA